MPNPVVLSLEFYSGQIQRLGSTLVLASQQYPDRSLSTKTILSQVGLGCCLQLWVTSHCSSLSWRSASPPTKSRELLSPLGVRDELLVLPTTSDEVSNPFPLSPLFQLKVTYQVTSLSLLLYHQWCRWRITLITTHQISHIQGYQVVGLHMVVTKQAYFI